MRSDREHTEFLTLVVTYDRAAPSRHRSFCIQLLMHVLVLECPPGISWHQDDVTVPTEPFTVHVYTVRTLSTGNLPREGRKRSFTRRPAARRPKCRLQYVGICCWKHRPKQVAVIVSTLGSCKHNTGSSDNEVYPICQSINQSIY